MKRELGLALIAIGIAIFVVGFGILEESIGTYVFPVGLALVVIGYVLWTRNPRPAPWPPAPPTPPTVRQEARKRRRLVNEQAWAAAISRPRKAVNLLLVILGSLAIIANLPSGSNLVFVIGMAFLVGVAVLRLYFGSNFYRRRRS